jgi:hypothetical protein
LEFGARDGVYGGAGGCIRFRCYRVEVEVERPAFVVSWRGGISLIGGDFIKEKLNKGEKSNEKYRFSDS